MSEEEADDGAQTSLADTSGCSSQLHPCRQRSSALFQGPRLHPLTGGAVWAAEPESIPRERLRIVFVGMCGGEGM